MSRDQKVTLSFVLSDGRTEDVSFTVPAGGTNSLTRTTTIKRFDLNTPDTPSAKEACGKFYSGVYFKHRDYIDEAKDTGVVAEYSMLDIPVRGSLPALHTLEVSPPAVEEDTGRIFCDIQLTCYYTPNNVRTIGSSTYKAIKRPAGTSGMGSTWPVTAVPDDYDVLRFYRSVLL